MSAAGPADRAALLRILSGAWLAQCCYAITKLGIPDLLADGPRPVSELAARAGADPRSLHRVLRALTGTGVVTQTSPGTFALGPVGEPLRSGVPRSSRDAAIMFGEEVFRSFADITHTLRTGGPAFDKVYGLPFYDYLETSPQAAATFGAAMAGAAPPAALASCDLSGARLVVDVGGGDGGLLSRILRAHPGARGILLELPQAVASARRRLSVAGLDGRVEFVTGSFFDSVPAGADVYLLCRVLHNWPDASAAALLAKIRAGLPPDGRVLVFEDLGDGPADGGGTAGDGSTEGDGDGRPAGDGGSVMDLLLLAMLPGWDRTQAQYRDLLARAGLVVRAVRPPPLRSRQPESVIEAVAG